MLKVSIILSLFIAYALCDQCANVSTYPNLNVTRYLGDWYEIERFPFLLEDTLRCLKAEYTLINPTTIKVNNSGYSIITGKYDGAIGEASPADPSDPAKLRVHFKYFGVPTTTNYWVVTTNYEYSLVYSCELILGQKFEYAWILSRQRTLDVKIVDTLRSYLQSFNININRFIVADQTNC